MRRGQTPPECPDERADPFMDTFEMFKETIMSFMLAMPRLSFHGAGAIGDMLDRVAQEGFKRALLVTDRDLLRLGLHQPVVEGLTARGLDHCLFGEVMPNPTVAIVEAGHRAFVRSDSDCIIALGGGSAIDAAKGISILTANPGPVTAYSGVGKVAKRGAFLAAINTTAGTAAEVTSNAVITDTDRQVKEVIIDPAILVDIAVDDPTLMLGIPPAVTAATGMDALTHAIEAYVAKGAHPLTDHSALAAIEIIGRWLPHAVEQGQDLQGREMMAYGQYLAGMAFNSAGLGLVHALAHQPGATHDLPHGVCNAILLPVICDYNRPVCVSRFAAIARALGVDTTTMDEEQASQAAIEAIRTLSARVGIPAGFSALGITSTDIDRWIDKAMADPCAPGNPRAADPEQIRALYLAAL